MKIMPKPREGAYQENMPPSILSGNCGVSAPDRETPYAGSTGALDARPKCALKANPRYIGPEWRNQAGPRARGT
jgi:hypothetical protein